MVFVLVSGCVAFDVLVFSRFWCDFDLRFWVSGAVLGFDVRRPLSDFAAFENFPWLGMLCDLVFWWFGFILFA